MEQEPTIVVYAERNAPKRRIVRSDGALYLLLLLLTFGMIAGTYALSKALSVNRLYLQIGLYALLLAIGYAIYRLRLVDYLYELTTDALLVTQVVGSRQKRLVSVPFERITEIGAYRNSDAKAAPVAYRGRREATTAIWYTEAGERHVLLINASDTLKEKLTEAAHA